MKKKFFILIFIFILFSVLKLYSVNYYVNDSMDGSEKWCTQPGNDANSGLATNAPKATITNLLSTYSLANNDVVYIDAGTYNECVKITNKGSSTGYITFLGAGRSNTLINGTGGIAWNDGCITIANAEYVKIKNLKFDFYNDTIDCYGIYAKNSINIIIQSNIVLSNRRSGIRLDNCSFSTVVNNICNYNNRAQDTWPAGIQLSSGSKSNFIKNNVSVSNARGIFLEGANTENNFILKNSISSNNEGLRIESPYNRVIDNEIFKNDKGILLYNNGNYNYFSENEIYNNSSDGIQVLVTGNGITNNKIHNNNGFGIKVDGANPNINFITRNEIFSNSSHGVALYRGNNTVISNQIYGNNAGIEVNYDGTNSFIIGNEIYNNSWYGIELLKSKNIISNNTIYNCSHGIYLADNIINNKILRNEIYNNTWDGIAGEGGDYNTIISNKIHNNSAAGISFWNNTNSYNIFKRNKIWKNTTDGLKVVGVGNIVISNLCYSNGNFGIKLDGKNGAPFTNEFNVSYHNVREGIMIDNAGSGSLIKNCTLFRNGADGIDLNGGSLLVKNCISVSNSEQGYNQSVGTMTVNYCDAYGNSSGAYDSATTNKCLTSDPKFESTIPSDSSFLHLSGWSHCINAGDPSDPGVGQGVIDMGVYEYQLPTSPPQITSISTNEIGRGNELTITGLNFQDNQYLSTVAFSNTTDGLVWVSEYNLWNDTTIKLTVPSGLSIGTTNSIKVTTWGGTDMTNKAVIIFNAYADIIKIGSKAPSVTPTKGKTTTSFIWNVYYRDVENDPPDIGYPKIITTTNGLPAFTNIMSTNVSSGNWTNGRLCQVSFTIPFEHSNISNFFIVKAATGNTNEYISGSFKLISRVDDTALPATGLSKSTATETSITIKWNIQEPYIASQTIYWNTSSPVTAGSSANLAASTTSYEIKNLIQGTLYYIIVRTYDDLGNYVDTSELKVITGGVHPPSDRLAVWNNYLCNEHPVAYIYVNNPAALQAKIKIEVYTIYGKLVKEIINAPLNNINQPIEWDGTDNNGSNLPSGVYLIYAEGYKYKEIKRIYIVR